jgi:WD40 repeat protein
LTIWDLATAKPKATIRPEGKSLATLGYSPDGKTLAIGCTKLQLLDSGTLKPRLTVDAHKGGVFSLVFAPDGGTIVTSGFDGSQELWDLAKR